MTEATGKGRAAHGGGLPSEDKSYKNSSLFSINYKHKAAPLTSGEPPVRATGATTPIRTATATRGDGEFPGAREYFHSTAVEALNGAFKELEPRCNRRPYRRARHIVREHLRTMLKSEGLEFPPLNRVLPHNVLGKEFHCQQVVAIRRNEVVRAMATGDTHKVARQYLNQRGWLLRARAEASVAPLFGGATLWMGIWKATVMLGGAAVAAEAAATAAVSGGVSLAAAGGLGYALFRNERRSAKTLRYAAQWLEAKLGPQGFTEIAKLPASATDADIQAIIARYSAG